MDAPHSEDSVRSMSRRLSRRTPARRRHRSKHTGKSLKREVDVSCDSRRTDQLRRDHCCTRPPPDCLRKSELDNAPGDPAHHRGDGAARRARRHHSRINQWRNTVSATRSPRRLVSRATHLSCQNVNAEDSRTSLAEGPADLRAAGCVVPPARHPITLEHCGDGVDLRRLPFHS
jgi:hypothetical protein